MRTKARDSRNRQSHSPTIQIQRAQPTLSTAATNRTRLNSWSRHSSAFGPLG